MNTISIMSYFPFSLNVTERDKILTRPTNHQINQMDSILTNYALPSLVMFHKAISVCLFSFIFADTVLMISVRLDSTSLKKTRLPNKFVRIKHFCFNLYDCTLKFPLNHKPEIGILTSDYFTLCLGHHNARFFSSPVFWQYPTSRNMGR